MSSDVITSLGTCSEFKSFLKVLSVYSKPTNPTEHYKIMVELVNLTIQLLFDWFKDDVWQIKNSE